MIEAGDIYFSEIMLYGAVLAIGMLFYIVIQNKKTLFWGGFVLAFIPLQYTMRFLFKMPAIFKWLPFFGILALGTLMLIMEGRKSKIPRSMSFTYFGMLIICFLSLLLNRSTGLSLFFAQRGYLMLFGFMFIFMTGYHLYTKDQLFSFLAITGLISTAFAFIQRFVFVAVLHLGSGDMVTGLFSADGFYLFFQLMVIVILLVFSLKGKELPGYPISLNAGLLVMMSSLAIANNKAGLALLGVMIVFVASQVGLKTIKEKFGRLMIGFGMLAVVFMVFESFYNQAYVSEEGEGDSYSARMTDGDYWVKYLFGDDSAESKFTKGGTLKRGAAIKIAWEECQKTASHVFFGRGPGSTSQTSFRGAEGELNQLYPGWKIGRVGLSWILAETGLMGVFANVFLLLIVLFAKPPGSQRRAPRDILIQKAFVFLAFIYLAYENLYQQPLFGVMIAIVLYPVTELPNDKRHKIDDDSAAQEPELSTVMNR